MNKTVMLRQGDTTTMSMTLSEALQEGMKLKIGIYTPLGKPLYETVYPDDGKIQMVDSTHYTLEISHEATKKIVGTTTLRAAVYTADKSLVNAGENQIPMNWEEEPVLKTLK